MEAQIISWLNKQLVESRQEGFVVGVSGGIDSAVVSTLCAMTRLPTRCLMMSIHQNKSHIERAYEHVVQLRDHYPNVLYDDINLTHTFESLRSALPADVKEDELAMANTRSRLRMTTLYSYANAMKRLVVGTGNKVEDYGVMFFTKYGDGGVDLSPIGNLTKTQVYELAEKLKVPEPIRKAAPSDGLWDDGRTDEEQLGATYVLLEKAMEICEALGIENRKDLDALKSKGLISEDLLTDALDVYLTLHKKGRHKMAPIPVCPINPNE